MATPLKEMTGTANVYISLKEMVELKAQARGFSFLPRQPVASLLAGRHASRLRGRGIDFEELRHYQHGDDVRQIDWKATLRSGRTQTRVYTEERERNVLLVVDQRVPMFFGSVLEMKSVTAARAAALSAWRTVRQRDRIGAVVFNDCEVETFRPQRSENAALRIMKEIESYNHRLKVGLSPKPEQLNTALRQAERLATHDFLICIISDGFGHDAETGEIVSRMTRHNDVIIIAISDPMEEELPERGVVSFGNGRDQKLQVDTSDESMRTAYRSDFHNAISLNRRYLLQRAVPVVPLSTTGNVPLQFQRFFSSMFRS